MFLLLLSSIPLFTFVIITYYDGAQTAGAQMAGAQMSSRPNGGAQTAAPKRRRPEVTYPSGDWMLAPPVPALGLRLSDEEVRIAVGLRLGTTLCEPHLCHHCQEIVDAKGLHGLVCRSGNGKHLRHSMINDVVWRSFGRAKIPAQKEPLSLSRNDGKRPDGVTIIPWKRGLCLTWDVTVPDTYAMSHLAHTSMNAGEAAERAAESKRMKYSTITNTHAFVWRSPWKLEAFGVEKDCS